MVRIILTVLAIVASMTIAEAKKSIRVGLWTCTFTSPMVKEITEPRCSGTFSKRAKTAAGTCSLCGLGGDTPECYEAAGGWAPIQDGPTSRPKKLSVLTFRYEGLSCKFRVPRGVRVTGVDCPIEDQGNARGSKSCRVCYADLKKKETWCLGGWGGIGTTDYRPSVVRKSESD